MDDIASLVGGHKRALVWGLGGGNDGLNTLPVVVQLAQRGIVCDMANSLNPSHHHVFEEGPERLVNRITPSASKRPNDRASELKPLVDGALTAVLPKLDLCQATPAHYGLSFKRGTIGLTNALHDLVRERQYDLIVGVDAGGDAFLRGAQDARVLSPIMDAMALYVLANAPVKSLVVEQGLGSDGELTRDAVFHLIDRWKFSAPGELLAETQLIPGSKEVTAYHAAYGAIRSVREGNTARRTLRGIYSIPDYTPWAEPHELRARVGGLAIKTSYEVRLYPGLLAKQFWLDPAQQARYNPLAKKCSSALECAVKAKFVHGLHTDLDLQYVWSGSPSGTAASAQTLYDTLAPLDGKVMQFVALQDPEPVQGIKWLSPAQRATVLQYCAMQLEQGATDMMLVKRKDAAAFPSGTDVLLEGHWALASRPCARYERDTLASLMRCWLAEKTHE